jgi:tetratricopeptide (TPR) repeat protein
MRYLIVFIFTALFIGLAGCGKEDAPPPPTAHALLVKKLFYNLSKGQYDEALKRIEKVQALDPANEFLPQFEEVVYCNSRILEVQKLLDANKVSEALKIIKITRKKYPLNRNMIAIESELELLAGLQENIKALHAAESSDEMNRRINAIAETIKKYPDVEVLSPSLRLKMKEAFRKRLYEEERARIDLLCDLAAVRKAERFEQSLNDTLMAMLTVDNLETVNKEERVKALIPE